jgi:sec-independent protein translocase protein TatB
MRKVSNHFRSGLDAMVREAELEDMERKWREQNEAIMKASPQLPTMHPTAEDMQAPSGSPAAETVPQDGGAQDGKTEDRTETRQAELHLPPPPP